MNDSGEKGFVLVATIWFVALLALIAVIVEGWIAASLDRALALQSRIESSRALIDGAARVAYAAVSGRLTMRGLEFAATEPTAGADREGAAGDAAAPDSPFAALDGRAYRIGDVVVRLQDEAGLYDLSRPTRDTLTALLKSYGAANRDGNALIDGLAEYVVKPLDMRAESAREADYSAAGLPPPRRSPLLTPWEPLRVLGWQGLTALWHGPAPFPDMVSIGPTGGLNLNTAPTTVFAAMTDIDERGAARFIAYRASHPIRNLTDVAAVGGVTVTETLPIVFIPSNILRVTLTTADDPLLYVSTLRLTPLGPAPYRIDYAVAMPQDPTARAAAGATAFPWFPPEQSRD